MSQKRKRFQRKLTIFRIAALIAIVLALPLSFFSREGYGIALENTPAYGWRLYCSSEGILDHEGYICGLLGSDLAIFSQTLISHFPPPVPAGGWTTRYWVSDMSGWFGLGSFENILGHVGVGRFSEGYPWSSTWLQKTGLMIPLWPLSLTATILLLRMLHRKIKSHKMALNRCPTCTYDLHAYPPSATCPECGTPVDPAHPK